MRAKFLLMPMVALGISLPLIGSEAVANDVFVDLSVLDSLGETASPAINNGPLFPIVKKAEPRKAVKKTAPARKSKAVTAKAKPAPKKKSVSPAPAAEVLEKVNIPAKPEIKVEVQMPEPTENTVKNSDVIPENLSELKDSPFAVAPVENAKEEISAAPTAPIEIKTETLPDTGKQPVIMEPINGTTPFPAAEEEPAATTVPESLFQTTDTADEQQDKAEAPVPLMEKEPAPAPLISPAVQAETVLPSSEIVFAPDSYELTDEDKARLDAVVASFENPSVNKIAIFAFNVDDGKDVFRKKRLSLNRAVEVRSYLLGKGYKNFSIKVVNIDEPGDKENKVVIEELK